MKTKNLNMLIRNLNWLLILSIYFCLAACDAQKLPSGFVYLEEVIPSIQLEMRYAGTHNFVGKPIDGYQAATCIVSEETANALAKVQSELKKKNLVMEALERDLRERVEQNSIRYNPPKLLEKPKTPELKAPVPTTGVKVDMSVTPVRQKMEKKIGEIVKEKNKTMKK